MNKLCVLAFSVVMGVATLSACQASPSPQSPSTTQTISAVHLKTLKQGTGKTVGLDDDVEIRFMSYDHTGKVLDGTMSGTPVIVRPSDMFEGLKQGLTLMQAGGVYELHIPKHLGYSDDERLAKQAITYKVEVLGINP